MISQAVRDLRWAIQSPSLIDTDDQSQSRLPGIDAVGLQKFLAGQTSHRVGYYFESLVHYWLLKIRKVDFIAKRLQIQDGTRTVGELDFLYRDEEDRLTHLETAVKFYLHFPSDNPSGSHYIGPNAADNFERKIDRLFEHQLPVSRQVYPDIEQRVAFAKGRIFYHPDLTPPTELPARLAADHLRNTWLNASRIDWFRDRHPHARFRILRKPHWLSDEHVAADHDSLLTLTQLVRHLTQHFADSDHPNLVSVLAAGKADCREVDRVFVVNDSWPGPD